MSAEAKEKGRTAFKEEQWEEAVAQFTQVIQEDPSDVTCLAIRSSAHQKQGNLTLALEDASQTITLQPTYVRGYIRKACVLRAMKDYATEVDTYLAGLEHCPGDESLTKGLSMARRLKTNSSKASQAAKTTQATRNAALSRQVKASQAEDMASFVTQTKMNLELQMVALQAQLDLVSEITSMIDVNEKMDLLFSLITSSGQHMTSIPQVVAAMEKATVLLKFGDQIHQALAEVMEVSKEDQDDDEQQQQQQVMMTRASFEAFVQQVVGKLNVSMDDFTEFIVYQVLFNAGVMAPPTASAAVAAEGTSTSGTTTITTTTTTTSSTASVVPAEPIMIKQSFLNDERMQSLFVLFDKDADSTVDFKEVAIGLYPLTKNMGEAAKKAAGLLLMLDKNDTRVLTYEQFAKLMLAVSGAFGMTFDELADQLTWALTNTSDSQHEVDESFLEEIMVAEEAYTKAAEKRKEEDQKKKTLDALSYSRTQKLFELWDANDDGTIDFQELLHGLRRYQKSAMGSVTLADAQRDALMIMGHDEDNNQALDPEEFAYAMSNYAEKVGTSLHELIDFMCVVSSESEAASEYETKFEEGMTQQRSAASRFTPSMGTILDAPEGGDDDEEEEDDW